MVLRNHSSNRCEGSCGSRAATSIFFTRLVARLSSSPILAGVSLGRLFRNESESESVEVAGVARGGDACRSCESLAIDFMCRGVLPEYFQESRPRARTINAQTVM